MKMLLSLVLLINLLGYLMMTNVPPGSSLLITEHEQAKTGVAGSLVLLDELSTDSLAALTMVAEAASIEPSNEESCEMLGPFADNQLAAAALGFLLPDLKSLDGLILAAPTAQFWLSIPTPETLSIPADSWHQFETKKRYLEDCMEVANTLKFH
ncbi:hypothetical protein N8087_04045 [Porticoccaceae bacterium]|nr:hypothetical protein [Porticoccaceae bacterium]